MTGLNGSWMRRSALATIGALGLLVGLSGAQPGRADLVISDVGVKLTGAQPAVTNGMDALLTATIFNDGTVPQVNASLVVATGGKVDNLFPLPANCSVAQGTTDTVTCTYPLIPAGVTEPGVKIAVTTPSTGTSMVSTASETTTLPDITTAPDTDETASFTTTLSPVSPCGTQCTQAFVPNGGSISRTSNDGNVSQTMSVPAGANTGGGELVRLDEVNTTTNGITCGTATQACTAQAAEAKFTPLDPSSTPTATNPLVETVTYNIHFVCNGLGTGAGCAKLFYLPTGVNSGVAPQVPNCSTFATAAIVASSDPCVNQVTKVGSTVFTYTVAMLKDITFPILSGGSK